MLNQHPWLQYPGSVTIRPSLFVKATSPPTPLPPPLTFFFHAGPEAFVESAETALVPLILVHNALPAEPAQIQQKQVKGTGVRRHSSTHIYIFLYNIYIYSNNQNIARMLIPFVVSWCVLYLQV